MGIVEQVLIGLATTLIGVVIGAAWQIARRSGAYWRSRRFWKPLLSGRIVIVVDKFDPANAPDLSGWEASGLVGGGGMRAALEVVELLEDIGLQNARRKASIIFHNEDDEIGDSLASNLFCIGGPDANNVNARVLKRINLAIPENRGLSRFLQPGRIYDQNSSVDVGAENGITLDYGRLIRVRNPYNKDRCVFILWGNSGYGTWAAAKFLRSRQLRAHPGVRRGLDLEFQFQTEVFSGVPQEPNITSMRELPPQAPELVT
jgi:hypothetical protein